LAAFSGVLDGFFILRDIPCTSKSTTSLPRDVFTLLALHFGLALVKRHKVLDLIVLWQRRRVVPRRVFDLSLVGRDGVVRGVALVGAVR
jgi:hypothetical protein